MDILVKEGTPKTPAMRLDPGKGTVELKGRSIPENSMEFYRPVREWLEAYGAQPQKQTAVHIKLEYFNTSSSKCLLDIFKKLEAIQQSGLSEVTINWYYDADDEDMAEAGSDYEAIIKVPFKMHEV